MVVAFGFGAGDFVTAISLLNQAANAFRRTTGAATQYQQAALELDSISSVLSRVGALRPSAENIENIRKIQLCSHICRIPLASFLDKIEKFKKHLGYDATFARSETVSQPIRRAERKIEWAVSLEKELAELKAKIDPQLAVINLLLQSELLENAQDTNRSVKKTEENAKKTLQSVEHLRSWLESQVAMQEQVLDLRCLIEDISDQQITQSDATSELVRASQAQFDRLETRLNRYEGLIRQLVSRYALFVNSTPGSNMRGLTLEDAPKVDESLSQTVQPDSTTASLSLRLLAIRRGLAEVILILLCFVPAVQRIYNYLGILSRAPTLLLSDNIELQDPLGRTLSLPFNDFGHWEVLQARLKVAFAGCPGERKIQNLEYLIMDKRSGVMLNGDAWIAVTPKARLSMSMLYYGENFQGMLCPRCHLVTATRSLDEITQCSSCSWKYWPKDALRLDNRPKGDWRQESRGRGTKRRLSTEDDGMRFTTSEMQVFKKVHLVNRWSVGKTSQSNMRTETEPNQADDHSSDQSIESANGKYECHVCEISFGSDFGFEDRASACRHADLDIFHLPAHGALCHLAPPRETNPNVISALFSLLFEDR